jgi:pimeloyl-ACP methyl ester carboxylesterase
VPENWEDTGGRHIELNVALVKSTAAVAETDPVVLLDGGPGQAATEDYPAVAPALAGLRRERHILLIDQRGTGGSNALTCSSDKATTSDVTDARADPQRSLTEIRTCLQELSNRADPRYYTTTDAVRDLEAVRVALQAPKLNLIGISYGTRVAQQFAARYPASVRSVVLDSPVPNTIGLGAEHARNLENALQAQFEVCKRTLSCKERFGDPYATLQSLRATLRKSSSTTDVRNPVTFALENHTLTEANLAGIVRMYAYSPETSALLPLTLDEAAKGNYGPILGQEVLMTADLSDRIVGGVQLSVICTEDISLMQENSADADTLLGNELITNFKSACREWPHRAPPPDFHQPLESSLPFFIMSGEFDPVTPPRYGMEIARTLSNARRVVAAGQGHNVIVRGCMPKLVEEFVTNLATQHLDATCLDVLKPLPAFINYSGAAP